MALITCPECGKQVSSLAKACPNCGAPTNALSGTVRIKMPNNVVEGLVGLFSSRCALVTDKSGKILWKGKHGENASFSVNRPTRITIDLGGLANNVSGMVSPGCKYALVQDMGIHMLATFRLTEVDVIDSE